jgi:hypothetical protein
MIPNPRYFGDLQIFYLSIINLTIYLVDCNQINHVIGIIDLIISTFIYIYIYIYIKSYLNYIDLKNQRFFYAILYKVIVLTVV